MNFEKIGAKILSINPAMRYVRFVDEEGKLIYDEIKKNKILLQDQEGLGKFSVDLPILKQIHGMFDESLGKTRFMYIIRDKVHQFVYYVDSVIIYITCEQNTERYQIMDIVNKIDSIIQTTDLNN